MGVGNRNELANLGLKALTSKYGLEKPLVHPADRDDSDSFEAMLADFPIYAAVAIRSRTGALLALAALREIARTSAPDVAEWSDAAPYRGNGIVKVAVREKKGAATALFYTLTDSAFAVSLNETTLHTVIDQLTDAPPQVFEGKTAKDASQLVLDVGGEPQSPLYRVIAWLADGELAENAGNGALIADAIFRCVPEVRDQPEQAAELMRATFGVAALTPDGASYTFGPGGLIDPARGSGNSPVWPALPVAGSSIDRVLSRLASVNAAVAFDDEPIAPQSQRLQSLHARMSLDLR